MDFISQILNLGSSLGSQPMFTNWKAGLELDKKNRIKVDPSTGQKIKRKDRRKVKNFLRNPFQLTAGNSLNFDIPNTVNNSETQNILSNQQRIN